MAHSNYNGIILYSANYHYDSDKIDDYFTNMKTQLTSSKLDDEINNSILFNKKKEIILNEIDVINNLFSKDSNIIEIYNLIAEKEIEKQLYSNFIRTDNSILEPIIEYDINTISNSLDYQIFFDNYKSTKLILNKQTIIDSVKKYISNLQNKINEDDIRKIKQKIAEFNEKLYSIKSRIHTKYNDIINTDNRDTFITNFNTIILSIFTQGNLIFNQKTQILNAIKENIDTTTYKDIYKNKEILKNTIIDIIYNNVFKPEIIKYQQQLDELSHKNVILQEIIKNFNYIYENDIYPKLFILDYDKIEIIIDKFKINYKEHYRLLYYRLNDINYNNDLIKSLIKSLTNEIKEELNTLYLQSDNEINILFEDFFIKKQEILDKYKKKYEQYKSNKERFDNYLKEKITPDTINIKMKALINDQIEKLKSEILRDDYIKKNISFEIMKSISSLNIALEAKAAKENIERQIFHVLQSLKSSEKSKSQVLDVYDKDLFVKLILNLLKFKINLNADVNQLINLLINHLFEKKIWEQIKNIFNDRYNEYKFTLTSKKIDDDDKEILKELVKSIKTLNKKIDDDKEILKELVKSIKTLNKKIKFAIPIFIYYKDGIVFDSYQILNENIKTITLKTLIDNYKY